MFIPENMKMRDQAKIAAFINTYNFAALISSDLQVTHVPLIYHQTTTGTNVLLGHMAKANRHWQTMENQRVTAVFTGPHSYISPSWYKTIPNVPTWNYAAIQCTGTFTQLDEDATRDAVLQLVAHHEPELIQQTDYFSEDYLNRLIKAVVGFTICIEDVQAKEKLGQHKTQVDQEGVYTALQTSHSYSAQQLAAYMHATNKGIG